MRHKDGLSKIKRANRIYPYMITGLSCRVKLSYDEYQEVNALCSTLVIGD